MNDTGVTDMTAGEYGVHDKRLRARALCLALCTSLAACGGGSGDDAPSPAPTASSAEGVYQGTLTGATTSSAFQLVLLENDEVWALYGTQGNTMFSVAGFIQGPGAFKGGTYASADAKDFGFAPAQSVAVNADYSPTARTVAGTVTAPAGAVSLAGGPIAESLYNYQTPANLATLVGIWSAQSTTGEGVLIDVKSTGAFNAVSGFNCRFTGTVAPRASGKNVFDVSLTFGASPCALPGQAATGIAIAYPAATGRTQLLVATVNAARTAGTAVFATK